MADRDDHAAAGHVSHDEADAILRRFNASHWGNPEEHARYSIPADPGRDDDIRLGAYIAAARKTAADRARLRALLAAYGRAVEESGLRVTALTRGGRPVLHPAIEAVMAEAAKWREWG